MRAAQKEKGQKALAGAPLGGLPGFQTGLGLMSETSTIKMMVQYRQEKYVSSNEMAKKRYTSRISL